MLDTFKNKRIIFLNKLGRETNETANKSNDKIGSATNDKIKSEEISDANENLSWLPTP